LTAAYDIQAPYGWLFILVNIFANPIFIYFLSTIFKTSQAALIVTIFIYLFGNLVLPIVLLVLTSIESTEKYAKVIRWFFCPLPIYDVGKGFYEVLINNLIGSLTGG